VLNTEQSAGSAGQTVERTEQSGRETEGQVSNTKQFVAGAKREGTSAEQSAHGTERQMLNTEQSECSMRAASARHGAIRARRAKPSVEHGAICERGEALKC